VGLPFVFRREESVLAGFDSVAFHLAVTIFEQAVRTKTTMLSPPGYFVSQKIGHRLYSSPVPFRRVAQVDSTSAERRIGEARFPGFLQKVTAPVPHRSHTF